jgi:hypothetical protein
MICVDRFNSMGGLAFQISGFPAKNARLWGYYIMSFVSVE